MLNRVLISNRGEIAIRIAKAASALGVESVGVYAPVDALSLHTRITTEAHPLGNGSSDGVAAYLDGEAVIEAAKSLPRSEKIIADIRALHKTVTERDDDSPPGADMRDALNELQISLQYLHFTLSRTWFLSDQEPLAVAQ